METIEIKTARRANEIFNCIQQLNGRNNRNVVNVVADCDNNDVKMSLNAEGLIEAFKQGIVKSYDSLEEEGARVLLDQLRYVRCQGMSAAFVLMMASKISAMVPKAFYEDVFDALGTAMANSGIAKLKAADLTAVEADILCGSDFAITEDGSKFTLVKQGVDDLKMLDVDEQQLEKLSAAAKQDQDMAMALEILTADCSEEQEVLWKGQAFDETFCTIIAKYYPAFAKFVDLGIDWNKPE